MHTLDPEALKRATRALSEEAGTVRDLRRSLMEIRLEIAGRGDLGELEEELELIHSELGKSFLSLEDYTETLDFILRLYERTEEELADMNTKLSENGASSVEAL